LILDASVAAKWFLRDEVLDSEAHLVREALLDDRVRASAPSIIWSEVAHAIVGAVRTNRVDPNEAREVSARFPRFRRIVDLAEVDLDEAVYRALRIGVSAYDAQYLILTARLGQSLVTADRLMFERGTASGYDVVWLGDVTLREGVLVDTPQGYQDQGVTLPYE
jgi:predicted nucleic acid-binding protein